MTLRYIAGGAFELGEAAPVDPGILMGIGLMISSVTAVYGLLAGGDALESTILSGTVPVLGDLKFVTSSFFDIGVYLIVIGLVLDVLRSLGAELDRQGVLERAEAEQSGGSGGAGWKRRKRPRGVRVARRGRQGRGDPPMTSNLVLALTIGGLFACGIYLMLSRNLIRVLLGFLLAGHAVNLLLLASGTGGVPPIVGQAPRTARRWPTRSRRR